MTDYAGHFKDGGYLLIDHSASPGLPEDIARNTGLDPKQCGEGKKFEAATLTCTHCKIAMVKNPLRKRERARCPKCNFHFICDFCAAQMQMADYSHTPYDKIIDLVLSNKPIPQLGSPQQLLTPSSQKKLLIPPD